MQGLMRKLSVVEVRQDLIYSGFYSTYFLIHKKDSGIHPILKLKRFNANIQSKHFRMETLQSVLPPLHPGLWLAQGCLPPCSHQTGASTFPEVPLARNGVPVLLSSVQTVHHTKGLTKIFQLLVAHNRSLGVVIYVYLDDLLISQGHPQQRWISQSKWHRMFSPGLF